MLTKRETGNQVKDFYNRVATSYDEDWSGIYRNVRSIAVDQIASAFRGRCIGHALDLAVGTGNAFHELDGRVQIEHRTGNDISEEMLRIAESKLGGNFRPICDDVLNISSHLSPLSQELIMCHFLFSYRQPSAVLRSAYELLKPGGMISVASSTKRDLMDVHNGRLRVPGKLLSIKSKIREASTPWSHQDFLETLKEHGFVPLKDENYTKKVVFKSSRDVRAWAIDSGWAGRYFDEGMFSVKKLFARSVLAGAEIVMHPLYPLDARNDITVVLAQRPSI